MRLRIFALFLTLIPCYAIAQEAEPEADITRFHFQEALTPERMEYFISNPPTDKEYWALTNEHYDMEKIACYVAEHHPEKIDEQFSATGYRWIPRCKTWSLLTKLPELKPLDDKYDQLSGIHNMCGTIYKDIYASLASYFIKAGAIPDFGKKNLINPRLNYEKFLTDMDRWASAGVWEKEQYKLLQSLKADALPAIAAYYEKQFHLSRNEAIEDATALLKDLDMWYLGGYSPNAYLLIPSKKEIDNALAKGDFSTEYSISQDQWIANMLQVAVVQHRPLADIKKLITHLSKNITPLTLREAIHQSAPHYTEALALLLEASPGSVNELNGFGKTALMYAVQYNNPESIKLLLAHKADANGATGIKRAEYSYSDCDDRYRLEAFRRTPLMYSAWYSTPEIMTLLLEAGANKEAADSQKKTACDYINRNTLPEDQKDKMRALLCS